MQQVCNIQLVCIFNNNFMKNIFFAIPVLLFFSCHSSRAMTANPTEQNERQEQPEDSILKKLQQNNELVLAFAVETYAWARTKNYKILTLNNNEWKGYNYSINNSRQSSSGLIPVSVSADSC